MTRQLSSSVRPSTPPHSDSAGGLTHVAWRDFCEDIDAQDLKDVTPEIDGYCRPGSAFLG